MKYSDELVHICDTYKNKTISRTKKYKELLKQETCFLDESFKYSERIWFVRNNRTSHLTCPICNKINVHINLKTGNNKTCSKSCGIKLTIETKNKIDPETGLTGHQLSAKNAQETLSQIDPETGLTGYQKVAKKARTTLAKIDPATGLTGHQLNAKNAQETLSQIDLETGLTFRELSTKKTVESQLKIDPDTGLTGYQSAARKAVKTKKEIDPETGLTGYQLSAKKANETKKEIDPETGLTGHQLSAKKAHETLSQIDLETGLTFRELSTKKTVESRLKIDPETGLTGYQLSAKKANETKKEIDPETGLTGHQLSAKKAHETLSQIDPETGLTGHQLNAKRAHETLSQIDPETGLTGHQLNAKRAHETLSQIDPETGLTGHQLLACKGGETKSIDTYKKRSNIFPNDYKLLTSESEYINSRLLKYSCNKCNSIRESYWPYIRCTTCYPYNMSIGENEVLEFCQSLINNTESNNRQIIGPLELDIYLPDHNLAIEYNGIFWHSSYSTESESRDYHLNKTELCASKNIQLFHVFENEWLDPQKQNIWKSIIRNRLGKSSRIYARKTTVKPVTSGDKSQFLDENHLQGNCQSSVNLGLYMDGELVSVMTFGRSRYDKKVEWELLRFCNRLGYSVVGGAGKLLKAFRRENDGSIISYADKRRSVGNLYEKLGFELSHETGPNYFYYKDPTILESRIKYQKHKLAGLLDVYDSELTESENMYMNGYRKIYDCGNQVWILE